MKNTEHNKTTHSHSWSKVTESIASAFNAFCKFAFVVPYDTIDLAGTDTNAVLNKGEIKMSLNRKQLQHEIAQLLGAFSSNTDLERSQIDEYWSKLNKLQATSQVQIETIKYKGVMNHLDESVTLLNRGELSIDISGWRISAGPKQDYIFPSDTYLHPFNSLIVDTHGRAGHSFGSNVPIWNDRGDTAQLFDSADNLVSSLTYGDHARDKVEITHIHYDGKEFRREGDEYVEITNLADCDILIAGWHIQSMNNKKTFLFPEGSKIEAFGSVRVYTHKSPLEYNEFSFDSPTAIWSNKKGECRLIDYLDRDVSHYSY
ncbi:lamin tail domain-containing protein [Marinomonas mediterranea]|uniref:lamin tail domain-containing protein n=1 Tax=Marinomonas mediterranea TaxID=119864 RepID=UPI0023490B71|nr:lamin tail domain-containing protein [Marinomonas mediterranea]WCN09830.1 lamin tail domain-containing protein [Marinomonas mediterranea]